MTVETLPIMAHSVPVKFHDQDNFGKTVSPDDKAYEVGNLLDKIDLTSFPAGIGDTSSGSHSKLLAYQEDLNVFIADTKIEYEAKDGSKVFMHFSYKTITRKVHYEVVQNFSWGGDAPENNPHPLDDYFGPKATAERILGFAKGLMNKFRAMEGDDKERLGAFIRKLVNGIDKGFRQAMIALGPISQDIGSMVHETYDRVMKGMALMNAELSDQQKPSHTRLTYEEEVSYTTASLELSIMA